MAFKPAAEIHIAQRVIGPGHPTYFIADVAANHDGDLDRAKALIHAAAEAGADAAKFQHFTADTIVSDYGFKALGLQQSHQASWGKSVYEVYEDASIDPEWTPILKETCDDAGIHFFTSPYSLELVDAIDPYVPAYKIGSGDITWDDILLHMATKGKPLLLATGASEMSEVERAMGVLLEKTADVVLMQCNTNYTGSPENFRHVNLNVLNTYAKQWPGIVLGLSDHTPGDATVLGAVALGTTVIEKHFTDDTSRPGPDHGFSMTPKTWSAMVTRTRELEAAPASGPDAALDIARGMLDATEGSTFDAALGSGEKHVEDNERETVVLQHRTVRITRDLTAGGELREEDLTILRPCPPGAISHIRLDKIIGRTTTRDLHAGEHLRWTDLE